MLKNHFVNLFFSFTFPLLFFCGYSGLQLKKANASGGKESVAVLQIPAEGVISSNEAVSRIVRVELKKLDRFEVINEADIIEKLESSAINHQKCTSTTCLLRAGKVLDADYILAGRIDRFGEKLVINFRLLDVGSGRTKKEVTMEYRNEGRYLEQMVEITLKDLFEITYDKNLYEKLVYFDPAITGSKKLILNGPRMGLAFISGRLGNIMEAPRNEGGYNSYPYLSQFGYQHEIQYLSTGQFQGLFEIIGFIGGLDQGLFVPTLSILNGFRHSKSGYEFAFGPTFGIAEMGYGFYDEKGLIGEQGKWYLKDEWHNEAEETGFVDTLGNVKTNPYDVVKRRDSRSERFFPTFSWVWAAGKTFRSGNLNIPVNFYVSPSKDGWFVGGTVGFNIAKYPNLH